MNSAHDEPSAISAADTPEDLATSRFTPPASAAVPDDLATLMVAKPTGSHLQTANSGTSPLGANPAAEVPFIFGRRIAKGGMGAILEASDCKLGRTIAVKVMLSEAGVSEAQKQRFIQEAAVLARLAHPNIVPVYDLGLDAEGELFYTMKLVKGRTLQHILDELRREHPEDLREFTLDRLLTIFRKVCDALAFAHANKIIHRDLKPENIMVGEFGEVLVMDWGIAKLLGSSNDAAQSRSETRMRNEEVTDAAHSSFDIPHSSFTTPTGPDSITATLDGAVMGTPNYMSPEQAMGKVNELDERSDIFSLGGILYAILTLRPPVEGKDVWEVLEKVSTADITAPTTFGTTTGKGPPQEQGNIVAASSIKPLPHLKGGRVPAALSAVAMKALSLDKAERYQHVVALSEDIEAYQGGFATSAENAGSWKQFALFVKRHKAVSTSVVASLMLLVVLSLAFTLRVRTERDLAVSERQRAERTLEELRYTAPTFEAQSRALLMEGKLDEALAKIGYAVKLDPGNANYRLARAHLLQSTQQIAEASGEYQQVLALRPRDGSARMNLTFCEVLLAEQGGTPSLSQALQNKLLNALVVQHRDLEAAPLAWRLNRTSETEQATMLAKLSAYTSQKGWDPKRLVKVGEMYELVLGGLQVADLSMLQGMRISRLELSGTSVSDLRPLKGLPLTNLGLGGTKVSDLGPLSGMSLSTLSISGTRVANLLPLRGMKLQKLGMNSCPLVDLSPLRGMPLEQLNMEQTGIHDLSPLQGMPLKTLAISRCYAVRDLSPLRGMKLDYLNMENTRVTDIRPLKDMPLKTLFLDSTTASTSVKDCSPLAGHPTLSRIGLPRYIQDIDFLSTIPNLKEVSYVPVWEVNGIPVMIPAVEFLTRHGAHLPEIRAVRAAMNTARMIGEVPARNIELGPDHRLKLSLTNLGLFTLDWLRGLPIKHLDISSNGGVRDLEPLRGMPLVFLNSSNSGAMDVAPIADCHDLEELVISGAARDEYPRNIELLRVLPKLRYLSRRFNLGSGHPEQTVSDFWKEYDAKQAAGKK